MDDNFIMVVGGPTASGKTGVAVELSKRVYDKCGMLSEIINADSIQLYNGLPILTAQPTREQMGGIRHHLFGKFPPTTEMNIITWYLEAANIINSLHSRGILPIVVGGTGFYLRSISVGAPSVPQVQPHIRQHTVNMLKNIGQEEMYNHLVHIDYRVRHRISEHDTKRILRAYEVFMATDKSIVSFWDKLPLKKFDSQIISVFVAPPKNKNLANIVERTNIMLERGVLDEVRNYNERYGDTYTALSNAIGYKEFLAHLSGEKTLQEAVDATNLRSRHYAKRQMTWFRNKTSNPVMMSALDEVEYQVITEQICGYLSGELELWMQEIL